jgi:hypothetical protein
MRGDQVGDHAEREDLDGRDEQHAAEDDGLEVPGAVVLEEPVVEER